jgi:hypothetical protein
MMHETLSNIQSTIQELLMTNELQHKSVRIAHYREASYFAFDGGYVYMIIDYPIGGSPTFCYVGETANLGPILRTHARNHRFSHAFVVDMCDSSASVREFAKDLLVEKFDPIFQANYYPFEKYRTNNFQRALTTSEVSNWIQLRPAKVH